MTEVRAVTEVRVRGDDLATMTSRTLQIQALLTPERMQGMGFAFALLPALPGSTPRRRSSAAR